MRYANKLVTLQQKTLMETNRSYRGKGTSRKLTKDGQPKHAGNWSFQAIHLQSLQSKDWHVRRVNGRLIIGDHTPVADVLGGMVEEIARSNEHFSEYVETGTKTVGRKQYDAQRSLKRFLPYGSHVWIDYEFIYREQIYTDGDFDYNFPEY